MKKLRYRTLKILNSAVQQEGSDNTCIFLPCGLSYRIPFQFLPALDVAQI